jgi:hypothetical protein
MVSGGFPCPHCGTQLQAVESYMFIALWLWLVAALIVLYLSGFRGVHLAILVLASLVPEIFLVANVFKFIIPPKIEPYLTKDPTLRLGR